MKTILLAALIVATVSCGGGVKDGSNVSGQNSAEKIARATQSLRLSQTSDVNSPIAISAAIDNFESFTALGGTTLQYVLYTTTDGNIVRISLDPSGQPFAAQTKDSSVTFTNYTASSVDVTINGTAVTAAIDSQGSLAIDETSPSIFKAGTAISLQDILNTIANAIRIFGCASSNAADKLSVTSLFGSTADRACRSLIVDAVRLKVDRNEVEQLPLTQDLVEPAGCNIDQPGWVDNFLLSQSCAASVADQIIREVFADNPSLITEINQDVTPEDIFQDELDQTFDEVFPDPIAETPVTEPAPQKPQPEVIPPLTAPDAGPGDPVLGETPGTPANPGSPVIR